VLELICYLHRLGYAQFMRIFVALCTCALLAGVSAAQNQSGRRTVGSPPPELRGVIHAFADSFESPQSLSQMLKMADVIVEGSVQSIFPARLRQVSDPASVETDALFIVDRVLKGKPESLRSLVIRQFGGKFGDVEVVVEYHPLLQLGDRHILFLEHDSNPVVPTYPRTDGNYDIVGGWIGNFRIENNAVKWLSPPDAQTFKEFQNGTAEDFIAQILAEVAAAR
jgi:hypothetical protein